MPPSGSLDVLDKAATGEVGMFEEPRPALPAHSEASGRRWATPVQSGASQAVAIDWRAIAAAAPSVAWRVCKRSVPALIFPGIYAAAT